MTSLYETLLLDQQLTVAVRAATPDALARTFAAHAGPLFDRGAFDALARLSPNP
jgi:hypothetical protein